MVYRAVLWDWDGTLNPSRKIIHNFYLKLKKHGKNLNEFRQTVEPDIYRYMYAEGIRGQEELKRTQRAYLKYLQKRGRLVSGGREILEYIDNILHVLQGVASESSRRVYITTVLERTDTSDFIDAIVAKEDRRDEINKWKLLAQRLGVPIEECIAVDDMKQGIIGAREIGVGKAYGVTYGYHPKKLVMEAQPDELVSSIPMLYNKLSVDLGIAVKRVEIKSIGRKIKLIKLPTN